MHKLIACTALWNLAKGFILQSVKLLQERAVIARLCKTDRFWLHRV